MNDKIRADIKEIIKANIIDDQLEVRLACSHMLAGFIHSFLIQVDSDLIVCCVLLSSLFLLFGIAKITKIFQQDTFKQMSKTKSKVKDSDGKLVASMQNIVKRHGGILGKLKQLASFKHAKEILTDSFLVQSGLCAIVDSNPYDIPSYLPDLITYLCARINDPAPIQVCIIYKFCESWRKNCIKFIPTKLRTLYASA